MTEIVIPAPTPAPGKKSKPIADMGERLSSLGREGVDIEDVKNRLNESAGSLYAEHESALKRTGWSTFRFLLVFAILVGLCVQAFFAMGRIVATYYVVYPITDGRAFDPEPVRWAESNYGVAKMVKYLNTHSNPDDKVFVFRQSDINYYSQNDIAVFTDDHYADLFRLKSVSELRQRLWDDGVRYIATPAYGLAEKNFSAFNALAGSPEHAKLVLEAHNDRLYEILPAPSPAPTEIVRQFDMTQWTDREVWQSTRFPMPLPKALRIPKADIERTSTPPAVTLSREKPPMADRELIDVLQPWDINLQTSPRSLGQTEFPVRDGTYSYEAYIKGDGHIRLYLDLDKISPDGTVDKQTNLLWEGVLDDRETTLSGQTSIQYGANGLAEQADTTHTARLYFTMMQGGYLTLYDFKIARLESQMRTIDQLDFEGLQRAYKNGWSLDQLQASSGYVIPSDEFSMKPDGRLYVQQPSSAARAFTSPGFLLPSEFLEEMDTLKLNRASETIEPIATLAMRIGGYGGLTPSIEGRCLNDQYNEDGTFSVSLPAISLRTPSRTNSQQIALPCMPLKMVIRFHLDRDFMRIPPDFRYADAVISDLAFSVEAWKNEDQLTVIDYLQSNEVKSLSLTSTPRMVPIKTDF